jgi:hypothetical protein
MIEFTIPRLDYKQIVNRHYYMNKELEVKQFTQ